MEGRKENRYNLTGICPECGKLLKLELIVATELVEHTTAKKLKEGVDAGQQAKGDMPDGEDKSGYVRPADAAGPAGTKDSGNKPADPGKGRRNKKTGGKQQ